MKKIVPALAAIALCSLLAFTTGDPLTIGSPMPKADLKMKDISGKEVAMKDALKENGVLVMFSCNTCPYVIKNQERTLAISEYAIKMKVGVIILNSNEAYRGNEDSFDAMKEYAKDQGYKWNYVVDQDHVVADAFGANRTPECFLFDKNLKLVYHGAIDDNKEMKGTGKTNYVAKALDEVLANKPVTTAETKPYGCTVKFGS